MGKATIISEQGEGRYTIQPEWDTTIAVARVATITAENVAIDARLGTIDTEISSAEFDYNYASDVLTAAIINQAPEAEIDAKQRDVLTKRAEWQGLKQTKSFLQLRKTANTKQIEFIEEMTAAPAQIQAWCADYTEGATGVVGTVEIGRRDTTPIIKPGGETGTGVAFTALTDGQLVPLMSGSPSATFYNLAMLPGAAKWKPRFRIGTASNIDTALDTMTVTLDALLISNVACNQETTLTGVPVVYMTCNAEAFENNDKVLVEFGADWSVATVVGFADGPKSCEIELAAIMLTPTSVGGSNLPVKSVTYDGGWQEIDSTGITPLNTDWSNGIDTLTWAGRSTRYGKIDGSFGANIYKNGVTFVLVPTSHICLGAAKITLGEDDWVVAATFLSNVFYIYRRPFVASTSRDLYDPSTAPEGWRLVDSITPPAGVVALSTYMSSWLFSPSADQVVFSVNMNTSTTTDALRSRPNTWFQANIDYAIPLVSTPSHIIGDGGTYKRTIDSTTQTTNIHDRNYTVDGNTETNIEEWTITAQATVTEDEVVCLAADFSANGGLLTLIASEQRTITRNLNRYQKNNWYAVNGTIQTSDEVVDEGFIGSIATTYNVGGIIFTKNETDNRKSDGSRNHPTVNKNVYTEDGGYSNNVPLVVFCDLRYQHLVIIDSYSNQQYSGLRNETLNIIQTPTSGNITTDYTETNYYIAGVGIDAAETIFPQRPLQQVSRGFLTYGTMRQFFSWPVGSFYEENTMPPPSSTNTTTTQDATFPCIGSRAYPNNPGFNIVSSGVGIQTWPFLNAGGNGNASQNVLSGFCRRRVAGYDEANTLYGENLILSWVKSTPAGVEVVAPLPIADHPYYTNIRRI